MGLEEVAPDGAGGRGGAGGGGGGVGGVGGVGVEAAGALGGHLCCGGWWWRGVICVEWFVTTRLGWVVYDGGLVARDSYMCPFSLSMAWPF